VAFLLLRPGGPHSSIRIICMTQKSAATAPYAHDGITLGIDFGTSNSAVSWARAGQAAQLVALEGSSTSLPTALFFDAEEHRTYFGKQAIAQYLAGHPGRLMRSLKSVLGSQLIHEQTMVQGKAVSYQEIIALFLRELKNRAHAQGVTEIDRVVIGRPIHFVDDDVLRDRQAQASLLEAAQSVGFKNVSFQFEPIAAALEYERHLDKDSKVLVVDIGGGTSDFSVIQLGPSRVGQASRAGDILATSGVHLGGTDFDHQLNLQRVMPLLGFQNIGTKNREVPSATFLNLSTWHKIGALQSRKAIAHAMELRPFYSDGVPHERLMAVLRGSYGHRIADAVEQAKISASAGHDAHLDLAYIEPQLAVTLGAEQLAQILQSMLDKIVDTAVQCVARSGLALDALDSIYLTGGSSALLPLKTALQLRFEGANMVTGDLFGAVASGLVYSA
jgi:hypothetical chaperone protein